MGVILVYVLRALGIAAVYYLLTQQIIPLVQRRHTLRNIAGPPSVSWWNGNWRQLFNNNAWAFKQHITETYGGVLKINALFWDQQLYVTDPLAITHIFQTDRALYDPNAYNLLRSRLSFGLGLVGVVGDTHTRQRRLLTPFFAPKYLRGLLPFFYPFAYQLCDKITKMSKENGGVMNIHDLMSVTALEYVGAGLGYTFDGLNDKKTNRYTSAAKALNPLTFRLSTFRVFLPWMMKLGPANFRKALVDYIPWPDVHRLKSVVYTLESVSQDILNTRREAYENGGANGKDILSAILRFNDNVGEDGKIEDIEIVGSITTTLFAGHETTSGTLSRILHQMCLNPDAQARLRKEVTEAREKHGDLSYEQLMELPYLDAVIKETLRVYPPVDQLYRTSNTRTILPFLYPVQSADGKETISKVVVPPNTDIIISIIGYNRNKNVWGEDAAEWKPERWLEPLRESVVKAQLPAVFSHMMTFTLGPRSCLGYKFAETEMKLALTVLLSKFEFSISPKEEIFWSMGGSIIPVLKGSNSIEPTLPLKVTPLAA